MMLFLRLVLLYFLVKNACCSDSTILVEEGWRQHGVTLVQLSDRCVIDFTPVHARLNERVNVGCVIGAGKIDKEGRQTRDGGEFRLGTGKRYVTAV